MSIIQPNPPKTSLCPSLGQGTLIALGSVVALVASAVLLGHFTTHAATASLFTHITSHVTLWEEAGGIAGGSTLVLLTESVAYNALTRPNEEPIPTHPFDAPDTLAQPKEEPIPTYPFAAPDILAQPKEEYIPIWPFDTSETLPPTLSEMPSKEESLSPTKAFFAPRHWTPPVLSEASEKPSLSLGEWVPPPTWQPADFVMRYNDSSTKKKALIELKGMSDAHFSALLQHLETQPPSPSKNALLEELTKDGERFVRATSAPQAHSPSDTFLATILREHRAPIFYLEQKKQPLTPPEEGLLHLALFRRRFGSPQSPRMC